MALTRGEGDAAALQVLLEQHRQELAQLSPPYQVEVEEMERYLLRGKAPSARWTSKYPFYRFTAEDLPPGLHASFWPDGQVRKVVCGSTTLELAHGKPAGRLETSAWIEEYHADGTWESWGGLFQHDRLQADRTFQQWARAALERLSGGISR